MCTNPALHRPRATLLLPVLSRTVGGATKIPVPTILFMINAAASHEVRSRSYFMIALRATVVGEGGKRSSSVDSAREPGGRLRTEPLSDERES